MKKTLSKRAIFTDEDPLDESKEEKERDSVLEELKYRNQRYQIDPKLNPETYTESDNWRNHWISSEG